MLTAERYRKKAERFEEQGDYFSKFDIDFYIAAQFYGRAAEAAHKADEKPKEISLLLRTADCLENYAAEIESKALENEGIQKDKMHLIAYKTFVLAAKHLHMTHNEVLYNRETNLISRAEDNLHAIKKFKGDRYIFTPPHIKRKDIDLMLSNMKRILRI